GFAPGDRFARSLLLGGREGALLAQVPRHLLQRGQAMQAPAPQAHTSPWAAMARDRPGATTTWPGTRTSTRASAALSVCVSAASARLGCALPLGWLCASTTAAAWWCRARSTTSRG